MYLFFWENSYLYSYLYYKKITDGKHILMKTYKIWDLHRPDVQQINYIKMRNVWMWTVKTLHNCLQREFATETRESELKRFGRTSRGFWVQRWKVSPLHTSVETVPRPVSGGMLVGQFQVKMLLLIWDERAATSPIGRRYFAVFDLYSLYSLFVLV